MVLIFRLWKWLITVCVSWYHSEPCVQDGPSHTAAWEHTDSERSHALLLRARRAGECSRSICESFASAPCPHACSVCGLTSRAQSAGRRRLCIRVWRGGKRGQMWCSCGRVLAFKGLDVSQWRKPERNTWHKYNVNPDTNLMPLILWVLPCFVTIVLLQSWRPACFRWKLVWFGSSFVTVFS